MTEVYFGNVTGTARQIQGHRSKNYQQITIRGGGTFSQIAGNPWMEIQAYMLQWAGNRTPIEPAGLGFRLLIDFSGLKPSLEKRTIQVHLLDADPASFPQNYALTPESFLGHDPKNVLFNIATRNHSIFPWVMNIQGHPSSSEDFFVFTDGNPLQVVHSLIVSTGPYTCAAQLPLRQWDYLGRTIEREIALLGTITAIDKSEFRIEINHGFFAQGVDQMHAHIKAGNLAAEPIT